MTEQEQAVVDRLTDLVDEEFPEPGTRALCTARGIAELGLSPEECTVDVLRALWAVPDEWGHWPAACDRWIGPVYDAVVDYVVERLEKWRRD